MQQFIQGCFLLLKDMNGVILINVNTFRSCSILLEFKHVNLGNLSEEILKLVWINSFKVHDTANVRFLFLLKFAGWKSSKLSFKELFWVCVPVSFKRLLNCKLGWLHKNFIFDCDPICFNFVFCQIRCVNYKIHVFNKRLLQISVVCFFRDHFWFIRFVLNVIHSS
jgi:hypothetical protein